MKSIRSWILSHKKLFTVYCITLLLLIVMMIVLFTLSFLSKKGKQTLTTMVLKNITIEVYQELPKLEDYLVFIEQDDGEEQQPYDLTRLTMEYLDKEHKKNSLKTITVDCSKKENCAFDDETKVVVDTGIYYVHIYSKQDQIDETVQLKVVDETAPALSLKEFTINEGETYQVTDFVVSCSDNSKKDCRLSFGEDSVYSSPGIYEVAIVATDDSGNETKATTKLIIQSTNTEEDTSSISKKGYTIVTQNGVTTIDGILIVNKSYSLPSNYGNGLTSELMTAFNAMKQAALNEGLSLTIASGFRSYWTQNTLYNGYVARDGKQAADTYSARPGYSEHQTGLAFDLNWVDDAFKDTQEGIWLHHNSYRYGFILRYPEGKTNETGYIYEPWHYRYVGVDLATKLYNNGDWITLEDYFGIESRYE